MIHAPQSDSRSLAGHTHPRTSIKDGEVVIEEGELRKTVEGRGFVAKPSFDESIEAYLRPVDY